MTAKTMTTSTIEMTQLSAHAREEIDELLSHFPADQKKSALLGALTVVQHETNGYLPEALREAVADDLGHQAPVDDQVEYQGQHAADKRPVEIPQGPFPGKLLPATMMRQGCDPVQAGTYRPHDHYKPDESQA